MSGAGRRFSTWNHSSTVPRGRQPEPRDRASARDRSPGHPRGTCNTDAAHRVRLAARTAGPRTHDRSSRAVAPSASAIPDVRRIPPTRARRRARGRVPRRRVDGDGDGAPRRRRAVPAPALAAAGRAPDSRGVPAPTGRPPGRARRLPGADAGGLMWLADARGLERDTPHRRLRNYTYAGSRAGRTARRGRSPRPKQRLKAIQRRILHEILDRIPPHDAAHGFDPGRSVAHPCRRCTSAGPAVVRLDLEDFFASVAAARVFGIFRAAGLPRGRRARAHRAGDVRGPGDGVGASAAQRSARAASPRPSRAPARDAPPAPGRPDLAGPGVARGLRPRSPARRARADARAGYSRYADDLAFSGGAGLPAGTLARVVAEIARDEGFRVTPAQDRRR